MPTTLFKIEDLGLIDFKEAWGIQKRAVGEVLNGAPLTLIFCEHPTVLTLGRLGKENNIFLAAEELKKRNIEVVKIDRGGEVTLHAKGQLVIYPIVDLNKHGRDLKAYLYKLEQVAIDLLADFGIVATRIPGKRGVWVQERKIVSLGIGVRQWVSFHGLAINVNTDLELFRMIKPCGLDVAMTSLSYILGIPIDLSKVRDRFIDRFEKYFSL